MSRILLKSPSYLNKICRVFSVCTPQYAMPTPHTLCPQLQSTPHVYLGGANKMHPQSWGIYKRKRSRILVLPRLMGRTELLYDQTQMSAHPCVPRPNIQGLDGSSSALQSGPWSGGGLVRGQVGLKSLIIGVFERTWVWSLTVRAQLGLTRNVFERNWVWSGTISRAFFKFFFVFLYWSFSY